MTTIKIIYIRMGVYKDTYYTYMTTYKDIYE